jgi:hypothetical protein
VKKIIFLFLFFPFFIHSSPVGNPSSAHFIEEGFFTSAGYWMNIRLGYEGNFVYNARFKQKKGGKRKIDNFEIENNGGSFTINFQNRLDLFAVLGSARMRGNWIIDESTYNFLTRIETQTDYDFLWAAGGRAIFFEWGNTSFSLGGRYSRSSPSLDWITSDGEPYSTDRAKFKYQEWQIDMGLSHKIDIFTPYIGAKYSRKTGQISGVTSTPIADDSGYTIRLKSDKKVGLFLGCALSTSKLFALNVEVRMIDEEAVTVSADLRF